MGFSERLAEFGGLPVLDFPTDPRMPVPAPAPVPGCGESSAAVAWRIDCWGETESGEPYVFEDVFHRFLNDVDTTHVTALDFGSWGDLAFAESHHPARSLVAETARFPALRAVFFGDIVDEGERPEIVYIEHIDLGPVLTAFPALEELWVRGTPAWTEEPIRAISECDFPELRHLELAAARSAAGPPDRAGPAPQLLLQGDARPAARGVAGSGRRLSGRRTDDGSGHRYVGIGA